ncbi:MAG: hypothetical protein ACK50J_31115 [Planctomyces sp.]
MRKFKVLMCALGLMAAGSLLSVTESSAEEKPRSAEKARPEASEQKESGRSESAGRKSGARSRSNLPPANRRLPAGYGTLSLSDEQKEKIFQVREEHSSQLKTLQEQLKTLRTQIDKEFRAVLTAEQKKQLDDLKEDRKRGNRREEEMEEDSSEEQAASKSSSENSEQPTEFAPEDESEKQVTSREK